MAICLFIAGAIIEHDLLKKQPEIKLIKDFQTKLLENEEKLIAQLEKIKSVISIGDELDINELVPQTESILEQPGIGFLVYRSGELIYWSNRSVAFYNFLDNFKKREGLVQLPNGYYLASCASKGDYKVVGLHLIKSQYSYENKYLHNVFFEDYNVPSSFVIKDLDSYPDKNFWIKNNNGEDLFALVPTGEFRCTKGQLYIPGGIYLFALLVLLYYFRREFVDSKTTFFLRLLGLATSLFIVYWLHLIFKVPKVFLHLQFFSPDYYAVSSWLPSLGDFFILTVFFLFWLYNFGVSMDLKRMQETYKTPRKQIAGLLLLFSASLFLLVDFLIEQLILNSTVSFSLNRIIEISSESVFALFSIGLLLFAVLYFLIRVNEEARDDFKFIQLLLLVLAIVLFLGAVQYVAVGNISIAVLVLFVVSSMLSCLLSKKYMQKSTLSYLILFVSVVSIYSLVEFYSVINKKEREVQKLFAVTLVAERDLAAEEFLIGIQDQLINDPAIISLLVQNEDIQNELLEEPSDFMMDLNEDVLEYIEKTYFNSYFRKYVININVCGSQDSLIYEPDNRLVSCNDLMNGLIDEEGDSIPGTSFYFMNNMNGRISYTGKLEFILPQDSSKVNIYIDLDSDWLYQGIGFPELLIEKSKTRSEEYKKFDYAKYYGGSLTDKFGEYDYNFHVDGYLAGNNVSDVDEFIIKKWHGREHVIYHTRELNYVIVSRPVFTIIDYLISFPYLFVFYFLCIIILLFLGNQTIRTRRFVIDLKFKIQAAIISIVFVSLLGVALATIFYNVGRYQSKHREDLNEKMKSIAEEIDMRLEDKVEITDSLVIWLHRELLKLSNIFRTDINIYGANGDIIASSRGEIFSNGLISTRMNARAYNEIYQNFQPDYYESEDIGELSYLSAYKPIVNNYSDYLGFINLPYFIKQDNYSQEISTFVVAFINLYVLLFLASIIAAVFISNQITRPLVLIQQNLQKIELGKHNDPIHYNRNDEIGSLVKEYNKKVDELAVSTDLLARSERESAWREMAKQIAHEIKNPLTPMKLNIQHLQRAKGKDKEYNEYLERVTATLIEQIDNLSNIATEFSNFAKIPTARNQVFKLAGLLQKIIDLYETHNRAKIEFNSNGLDHVEVNADREQLSRAIINLIRNSIQSMPIDEVGRINIWLKKKEDKAIIAVKDDGSGIPVKLRDKLFSPSFTTKTSGMGLGLAIVKNIVENFAGKIWFETELNKGSIFYLEIPIHKDGE